MGKWRLRGTFVALVLLMLLSPLASLNAVGASPPSYTLYGQTYIVGNTSLVPSNITVNLISSATHQVYTTTTGAGGSFSFTSAATSSALAPGWWGLWIPPQAHVRSPNYAGPFVVLPSSANPVYFFENSTQLTNAAYHRFVPSITTIGYTGLISGIATWSGGPANASSVRLLDPVLNGFVIANATTNKTGGFSMRSPPGTWVLETSIPSGSLKNYNFTQVTVTSGTTTVNPVINNYLVWGLIDASTTGNPVSGATNVTLFDTANDKIYSQYSQSPYYVVGTYPGSFTGPAAEPFELIIAPIGYGTVAFPLSVSPTSPSGGVALPRNVLVPPQAPPAVYATTLALSSGFRWLNVSTTATLGNDSTFPDFPNATVGQLWSQLALDFQHNITFVASATWPTVLARIQSTGPFFAADQAGAEVNGTKFGVNGTLAFTSSTPTGLLGLSSPAGLSLSYAQSYNASGKVPGSGTGKSYTFAFTFRYPTSYQAFNYTVTLPTGYVLQAGTPPPAHTLLLPAGPGGTWTSFKLVAKPSPFTSGTANFTVVKYSGVTANVNVSVANFAFSQANVLNRTHGNYSVIVGLNQNATFSAANSTYPAGSNGSAFRWNFGDGSPTVTKTTPITYHTFTVAGKHDGWLNLTASSGLTSNTTFHVYAGGSPPVIHLVSNATAFENRTVSGASYLFVNWSRSLSFNISTSTVAGCTGCPNGVLSVADWNLSSGGNVVQHSNFTASGAQAVTTAFVGVFSGHGPYLTNGTVNGTLVPFLGWEYNLTVTLWDGTGQSTKQKLPILVKDTEKPTPVAVLKNSLGKTITGQTVTEGSNHLYSVTYSAANSSDPHNGSIVSYNWTITVKGNNSANRTLTNKTGTLTLAPQSNPYSFNLTVKDRAGNKAFVVVTLTVQINRTTRPVLAVAILTGPSGPLTEGSSYTFMVNVTNTIGTASVAQGVTVTFYLLPPSGVGSPIIVGGSPGSVQFFNYTNGVVSATPTATGSVTLKYNQTLRAVLHWTPGRTGNFDLYANATASNEFSGDYKTGTNVQHIAVTINPSPTTLYEEYGAIAAAVIIVIAGIVVLFRRRSRAIGRPSAGKAGLERGRREEEEEEEEEADET